MSASAKPSIGVTILQWWNRLHKLPFGKSLFSLLVGYVVPYSGSIGARIIECRPGYTRVFLRDRRRVRNHLNSIHALALANLGEIASGFSLLTGLPSHVRGIVTELNIEYLKKARGNLVAEGRCDIPTVTGDMNHIVNAVITDAQQDIVARVRVTWRLGVVPST